MSLHWRHNEGDGASNHQPHNYLLNGLFRRRPKKTPKLCVTGLCAGNSPHKGPVTRKTFPFDDDVIMYCCDHRCGMVHSIIIHIHRSLSFYTCYVLQYMYRQTSNISAPNPKTEIFLVSSCSCLCAVYWSQVLSREWRCSRSSADRRCSNYIRVINNFIA